MSYLIQYVNTLVERKGYSMAEYNTNHEHENTIETFDNTSEIVDENMSADDTSILTSTGSTVRIWFDPIGFLGDRIRLSSPYAPEDLQDVEIGAIGDGHLQLPGTEYGMSPEVLRAIADLLEQWEKMQYAKI